MVLLKSVVKIRFWLKSAKNKTHENKRKFMIISRWMMFGLGRFAYNICGENQNKYFMSNIFFENRDVYDTLTTYTTEQGASKILISQTLICFVLA
jgi:hypothetical protein